MSLIHDALREQDGPVPPVRPAPRASWWASRSAQARGGMLLATAGVVGFLLAGTLLLSFGKRGESGPPARAGASAASPARPPADAAATGPAITAVPSASPAMVHAPQPPFPGAAAADAPRTPETLAMPALAPPPDRPDAGVADAAVDMEPTPAAPPPVRAPAPSPADAVASSEGTAPAIRIKVERRTDTAPAGTGMDNRAVEQAVGEVESAMAGGDLPAARQALARLGALLPPESLTLLRMQAWIAHAGNDTAQAESLYRRIAERVPEDVNAGVNIALLDARRGEADAARQRLTQLSGRYPRSPQVARALAELDSTAP